jgi:uncharacterized membrane protein YecN with MAPEG domain
MSIPLPVTSMIALPMALLMIGLAYRVAALRIKNKIGLGMSSNKTLAKAMAAHGNATENVPLTLILFAMAEIQGADSVLLSVWGVIFIVGRFMNALGVSQHAGRSLGRMYGIILSWFAIVFLGGLNIWLNLAG